MLKKAIYLILSHLVAMAAGYGWAYYHYQVLEISNAIPMPF